MARLQEIVIDAQNPPALARFWAAVLETYKVRSYDPAEIARLAARGLTPDTDPAVAVDGDGPTLFFQKCDAAVTGRNRIHLDVRCADRALETERLQALGAKVREVHHSYTVMLDPEGNRFCVQGD